MFEREQGGDVLNLLAHAGHAFFQACAAVEGWHLTPCFKALPGSLQGLGLQHGDRVAVLAYNRLEWMEIYTALSASGLVAVPINFRLLTPEIEYILGHCEAKALIVEDSLLDRVQDRIVDTLPAAPDWTIDCRGFAARDALPKLRGVKGEMLILRTTEISLTRPVRTE